ncbi:MAG: hypothetical protein HY059_21120 [Proteobacteria bacterium]|nr:hypothetical protein [Pseudomonadota bacterium]
MKEVLSFIFAIGCILVSTGQPADANESCRDGWICSRARNYEAEEMTSASGKLTGCMIRHFVTALDRRRVLMTSYFAAFVDGKLTVGYIIGRGQRVPEQEDRQPIPLESAILYGSKGTLDTRGWSSQKERGVIVLDRTLRETGAPDISVGVDHLVRQSYGAYLKLESGENEKFIVVHTEAADDIAVQFYICIDDLKKAADR